MIPAEAVEAAAWALYERDHIKGVALGDVRRALEAAAPYLMAQAWDEGASWMNDSGANTHDDNPYRNRT